MDPFSSSGFVLNLNGYYVDRLDGFMVGSSQTEQSKFTFEKLDEYRIRLISSDGNYTSTVLENSVDYIKATSNSPDESAIFRVYNIDGKLSIKADTGSYVSWWVSNYFRAEKIGNDYTTVFNVEAPTVKSGTIMIAEI